MNEPLVTWNLFLTPFVVALSTGLILVFVRSMFTQRDDKDKKIAELLAEKESALLVGVKEFRERVDGKLEEISEGLILRVDWDHCTDRRKEQDTESEKRRRLRDIEIHELTVALKKGEVTDVENIFAHSALVVSLERLEKTIAEHEESANGVQELLFDKLSAIDISLKLINGTTRNNKEDLAVHIAKGHGGK